MAIVILTLMIFPLVLSGTGLVAEETLHSVDTLADGWKNMETRSGEIDRTKIEVISKTITGSFLDITIKNSGQTGLFAFKYWDVVVHYQQADSTHYQVWIPFTEVYQPGDNQWALKGIYKNAASAVPEVFQPNILDPEEEMVMEIKLEPPPGEAFNHLAIIGTPNGVSISTTF